jgi:hypothetical protein
VVSDGSDLAFGHLRLVGLYGLVGHLSYCR